MTSPDLSAAPIDLLAADHDDGLVRQLVAAAQLLYDGSLADLAEDIRRRHNGQPYLFATDLALRDDVLQLIQRLQDYERERGVVLASVLQEVSQ